MTNMSTLTTDSTRAFAKAALALPPEAMAQAWHDGDSGDAWQMLRLVAAGDRDWLIWAETLTVVARGVTYRVTAGAVEVVS